MKGKQPCTGFEFCLHCPFYYGDENYHQAMPKYKYIFEGVYVLYIYIWRNGRFGSGTNTGSSGSKGQIE